MAYNPFGEDTGVEDFSGQAQTEEERKKRLARMASLMTGGVGLGDTAGQMLGDRIAPIQQAITDPQAALEQRYGAPVKRAEEIGQMMQGQQPQGPVGPVMPEQVQQERQAMMPPVAQMQQPVAPVAPVAQEVPTTQLPQPGEPVQVAGPAQMPPARPISPTEAQTQAESNRLMQQNATAQGVPTQAEISPAAKDVIHHTAFVQAYNSPDPKERSLAMGALMSNPDAPEALRMQAQRTIYEDYRNEKAKQDAIKKLEQATPNELARYMQEKSKDEGSYLKAILFQRIGLSELAKQEQEKLSPSLTAVSATDSTTGQRYTAYRNKAGEIVRAFNPEGKQAGQEEVARLSASTMPTQSHLLPSVHGSPVVNAQGETGFLMYDPQTQSSYVQVGNQRKPTTGWTTMSQNVQNVYSAAQAKELGTGAGQGFTPQPMRPLPGGVPQAAPGVAQATTPEQVTRAQGDVAGLQREIATIPNTPQNQGRLQILNQELAKAQSQVGAVQGLPPQAQAAAVPGGGIAQQKANLAVQEAQQKEGIQVAGQRSQAFNKILDEEVRPQAQQGDTISSTRKQQFAIFDRPGVDASKIFGIANGAGQAPGDQRWTMLRDTLLGKTTATDDQIRERAAALGLNREEQAALAEYNIANAKINAATLKQTAGAGSVSDAEQRANREMNVDPTKIPGLGAFNAMAQSQFEGDKARYKADWASTHPATNALQLDKAWRKESQQLTEMYTNISKERAKFITENGATTAAVKEAYKRFPVPEYDPGTESWKKTKPLAQILGR